MNYLKRFFITGISVFLMGWLISAKAAVDSVTLTPPTTTPASWLLLGQGIALVGIAGATGFNNRAISTGLAPCSTGTPKLFLTVYEPLWVAGDNALIFYSLVVGTQGVYVSGGTYSIDIQTCFGYHSKDTTNTDPTNTAHFNGNYTGMYVNWAIYCGP